MSLSNDPVALQTHYLVIATFCLAIVTVLAIVVPLITSVLDAKKRRRAVLAELLTIIHILRERVDAICADAPPIHNIAAGISALGGRAFSGEVVRALPTPILHHTYSAIASATDAILAYVDYLELRSEPVMASTSEGVAEYVRKSQLIADHRNRLVEVREAAYLAAEALRQARHLIEEA